MSHRSPWRRPRPLVGRFGAVALVARSRAVIVIFVDDPEFIVEPTVRALLTAATS
jgi:hypothetical protein